MQGGSCRLPTVPKKTTNQTKKTHHFFLVCFSFSSPSSSKADIRPGKLLGLHQGSLGIVAPTSWWVVGTAPLPGGDLGTLEAPGRAARECGGVTCLSRSIFLGHTGCCGAQFCTFSDAAVWGSGGSGALCPLGCFGGTQRGHGGLLGTAGPGALASGGQCRDGFPSPPSTVGAKPALGTMTVAIREDRQPQRGSHPFLGRSQEVSQPLHQRIVSLRFLPASPRPDKAAPSLQAQPCTQTQGTLAGLLPCASRDRVCFASRDDKTNMKRSERGGLRHLSLIHI